MDYLGGSCVVCGTTENLHFDHIRPTEKSFEIKSNVTLNEKVKQELDKCQLLCASHHMWKTVMEHVPATHGKMYMWMKLKCTCDLCNIARKDYYVKRNSKRRVLNKREQYGRRADHGEMLMYRRGCKCAECKRANASYAKTLRERKNNYKINQ